MMGAVLILGAIALAAAYYSGNNALQLRSRSTANFRPKSRTYHSDYRDNNIVLRLLQSAQEKYYS